MPETELEARFFLDMAAAYVRGTALERGLELMSPAGQSADAPDRQQEIGASQLVERGLALGLKLYPFKRTIDLPRVNGVLGILKSVQPADLLDIGSGRGVFLWPLLDQFPALPVTAIDLREDRVAVLRAVQRGGIARLAAKQMSVEELDFADNSFDVATVLEVLEHLPRPEQAARELVRVARRFVIASVPSKPDNNPEHIHLFDRNRLSRIFADAGARSVKVDHVLNHMICVAAL